ncbi:MAG: DUF1570 domain-containing protein [Planctomycetaceae bacterium]|jgi:hypothetical protein|nr:DUF1570 domain-containing protein [Planctomycetaceae bacterium]
MNFPMFCRLAVFCFCAVGAAVPSAFGIDYADFSFQEDERQIEGRFLNAIDSGGRLVFETRDRQYFFIKSKELIDQRSDAQKFTYYSDKEMLAQLEKEFPKSKGYYILDKQHFLVVYTTSRSFANWYGRLLEKLYSGYVMYWKRQGVILDTAEHPLVAVVLSSKDRYMKYAEKEGVKIPGAVCAYYNQRTNRVVMYDMSGKEKANEGDQKLATAKDIKLFMQQPGSYTNVETVIHEAAHQVGFNCGMHTRLAPNPTWVCEGLATFHEVPDAKSPIGWTLGPRLNPERLAMLKEVLRHREDRPFESVIVKDGLFMNEETALTAYSAAWGLMYYLAKTKSDELAQYLNKMREKTPESRDSAKIRVQEFEECFGSDWEQIYKDIAAFFSKAIKDEEKKVKRDADRR